MCYICERVFEDSVKTKVKKAEQDFYKVIVSQNYLKNIFIPEKCQ